MELSDTEKQMVARLRKKHQQMLRWRWCLLIAGAVILGASIYELVMLARLIREPSTSSVLIIACCLPQIYLILFLGGWQVGYTWVNWNGNPQEVLLLKLIDDKQDAPKIG